MKLSKNWTTVTPFSRKIALILFIAWPFLFFYLGAKWQSEQDTIQYNMQLKPLQWIMPHK